MSYLLTFYAATLVQKPFELCQLSFPRTLNSGENYKHVLKIHANWFSITQIKGQFSHSWGSCTTLSPLLLGPGSGARGLGWQDGQGTHRVR